MRLVLAQAYQYQSMPEKNLNLWRNLFIVGAFFGGVCWGLTGLVLLTPATSSQSAILIILILAGVTAGAAPLLSAILAASIAFLTPALLTFIVHFLLFKRANLYIFDSTLVAYFIYLLILSNKTHKLIEKSLSLQFENSTLVKGLSEAVSKLEFTATHDPLTQVANRTLFEISLTNAINRAAVENKKVALLYIDLDGFKEVNDEYGHNSGDQVLVNVVNRLSKILRRTDLVSRVGGDEFTVILENIIDIEDVKEIAEKICHTVAMPMTIGELEINVTVCIGISIYPTNGRESKSLLREADKAMYYVKEHGHNNYYFTVEMANTFEKI